MHGRGTRWATLLAVVVLAWSGSAAGTDGIEPIGISMPAQARGGADVAVGDSGLSQIDNPATLTLSPDHSRRLDVAGQLLMPRTHWSGRIDSDDSTFRHIPLGHVGLVFPQNERLTLGLAVHCKSQLGSRYKMRHWVLRNWKRRVGADMRDVALSLNLGYRSTEKLSIGMGVRGEVATAEFNTVNGPVAVDFGRGYAVGGGFQLGLHYQALPTLAFGLGYRSPTWFQHLTGGDSDAELSGESEGSAFGFRPIPLGKGSVERIRLAQRVAAGLAWDVTDRLKLVGEVRWINYSNSTFHTTRFTFSNLSPRSPLAPSLGCPVGLSVKSPLGYRDQWVYIAGAEFKLAQRWKLGVGYHYGTNPVSGSALLPAASMITQHHVTVGLRYEADNWWVGAGYILGLKNTSRAGRRTRIPLGADYERIGIEQMQHSATVGFGFNW